MNGETVCSNHPVCVFSSRSITSAHDEKTMKLTQEERCSPIGCQQTDAERQGEGRRTNPKDFESDFLEMEMSSYSQRSACWSDQPPSPRQQQQQQQQPHPPNHPHHRAPSCLRNPPEHTLTLSHSLSPTPLHANNRRRGVRFKVKGKKSALRLAGGKNSQNRKVTDYFPIRRSSRKSKTELKDEEKKQIDELITKGIEEGMEVQYIEGKGRGVFASRSFYKGEYVVEYHGDLLEIHDAKQREAEYALNPATGCYMYYFQFLCKTYCVDATKESGRMGRLINHSKTGNCQTKLHDIGSVPHLILVASRDIDEGEELLYDYGDRSKDAIAAHPWLKY